MRRRHLPVLLGPKQLQWFGSESACQVFRFLKLKQQGFFPCEVASLLGDGSSSSAVSAAVQAASSAGGPLQVKLGKGLPHILFHSIVFILSFSL